MTNVTTMQTPATQIHCQIPILAYVCSPLSLVSLSLLMEVAEEVLEKKNCYDMTEI
jgi:hypothetical protein